MDSIPKSTEMTTDEGSDKQTIYETTSLQSINKIKTQAKLLSKPSLTSLTNIKKNCLETLHHKYSKANQRLMIDPIVKTKKRQYLLYFKEMMTWIKTTNNIRK